MGDASEKPALVRLARTDLDLAFRTRGEAALLRIAYYGRVVARVALHTGGSLIGASFLAALVVPRFPWVAMVLFLTGAAGALVSGLARVAGLVAAGPAHTARAVRIQLWLRPDESEGGRATLRGRVAAVRTVKTLDGRPAVFVRKRATRRGRGAELQEAEDFLVEVDDGSGLARVAVAHALLLDQPQPVFGSWMGIPLEFFPFLPPVRTPTVLEQSEIVAGDFVEVVGRVETVVDPSVWHGRGRETPLLRVFHGTPDEPLLLRTVPAKAALPPTPDALTQR